MKKNKANGSLAAMLTKNYLAFTSALIVVFAAVYWLWSYGINRQYALPDIDRLVSSQKFQSGDYESVDAVKYLGKSGGFAVLDENAQPLYSPLRLSRR